MIYDHQSLTLQYSVTPWTSLLMHGATLSLIIFCKMPKQQMIFFLMNLAIAIPTAFLSDVASTYLMKYLVARIQMYPQGKMDGFNETKPPRGRHIESHYLNQAIHLFTCYLRSFSKDFIHDMWHIVPWKLG